MSMRQNWLLAMSSQTKPSKSPPIASRPHRCGGGYQNCSSVLPRHPSLCSSRRVLVLVPNRPPICRLAGGDQLEPLEKNTQRRGGGYTFAVRSSLVHKQRHKAMTVFTRHTSTLPTVYPLPPPTYDMQAPVTCRQEKVLPHTTRNGTDW